MLELHALQAEDDSTSSIVDGLLHYHATKIVKAQMKIFPWLYIRRGFSLGSPNITTLDIYLWGYIQHQNEWHEPSEVKEPQTELNL